MRLHRFYKRHFFVLSIILHNFRYLEPFYYAVCPKKGTDQLLVCGIGGPLKDVNDTKLIRGSLALV